MTVNTYYLSNGVAFPIDPEKETHPEAAKAAKLRILERLQPTQFLSPLWTAPAVRALATGLVPTTIQGTQLSKASLVSSLIAYQTKALAGELGPYTQMSREGGTMYSLSRPKCYLEMMGAFPGCDQGKVVTIGYHLWESNRLLGIGLLLQVWATKPREARVLALNPLLVEWDEMAAVSRQLKALSGIKEPFPDSIRGWESAHYREYHRQNHRPSRDVTYD